MTFCHLKAPPPPSPPSLSLTAMQAVGNEDVCLAAYLIDQLFAEQISAQQKINKPGVAAHKSSLSNSKASSSLAFVPRYNRIPEGDQKSLQNMKFMLVLASNRKQAAILCCLWSSPQIKICTTVPSTDYRAEGQQSQLEPQLCSRPQCIQEK